ncbi:Uncharacterized protein TCM_008658 [Theobroma cacao]|uniref:RNase H type-1 domain-containing protein n=1 Tax=Theobroma cacao TaxID=3641 RepID=A0A061E579_THECC|nr:Uncharacterized protein TCM_008658 [Theobroma cacao]
MWMALPKDWMKFNVDGTSFGSTRKAEIGGILHDNNGLIKVMFSKSIVAMSGRNWGSHDPKRSFNVVVLNRPNNIGINCQLKAEIYYLNEERFLNNAI